MRSTIKRDRETGEYHVLLAGRVIYITIDLDDAREYAASVALPGR